MLTAEHVAGTRYLKEESRSYLLDRPRMRRASCRPRSMVAVLSPSLQGEVFEMNCVRRVQSPKIMNRAEFLRIFPMRASGLMWLTGAGASASARIRTAGQMIWHFKQQIF